MNWWLYLFPFMSALIGWAINSLFLKLLFHPVLPKKIFGITFQGLLPRQQQPLAEQIGRFAVSGLFSFENIEQKISDPKNLDKIMPMIEQHIDTFLRVKLSKEMPVISMFIGDKTIATMKGVFMKELGELFPQVMKSFAGNLKSEINLEKVVADKIASYPIEKLEAVFNQQLSKEMKKIRIIGAFTGFLIGLLQILLTLLLGIA
ncbi:MAG: DUF445 family protein [Bacteroidetes bacterium]|nr:DUF445 family protein [Bacteroidota bacterium]